MNYWDKYVSWQQMMMSLLTKNNIMIVRYISLHCQKEIINNDVTKKNVMIHESFTYIYVVIYLPVTEFYSNIIKYFQIL